MTRRGKLGLVAGGGVLAVSLLAVMGSFSPPITITEPREPVPDPLTLGALDVGELAVRGNLGVDGGVSVQGDYLTQDGTVYSVNGAVGTDTDTLFGWEVTCGTGTQSCLNGNGGIEMGGIIWGKQGARVGVTALPTLELYAPVTPGEPQRTRISVAGAGAAVDVPIRAEPRGAGDFYVVDSPLTIDSGQKFCLLAGCAAYIQWTGTNIFIVPGAGSTVESGPMVVQNTFTANSTVKAGNSSTMAAQLAGGTAGATLSVVNGAGSAADGGLGIRGGFPNGTVTFDYSSGIKLAQFGAVDGGIVGMNGKGLDIPVETLPTACNSTTGPYMSRLVAETRPDGGFEHVPFWCDSQDYRSMVPLLSYSASSADPGGSGYAAGNRWLTTNPGISGGELWYCTYDVAPTGGGVGPGTYTVQVKQGATVLCESPAISCTATGIVWDGDPRPGTGNGPCGANYVIPRPAGSAPTNYVVNASFSAGCTSLPVGNLSCYSRRLTLQRTVP